MKRYRARWVYWEDSWVENGIVEVNDRIVGLTTGSPFDVDLGNAALLPGMINTHSHAFQRAIRGRTEHVLAERLEDDFWTWRASMYSAALTFGPEDMYSVARLAYEEMRLAGVTTVAEFHYVHHAPDGTHYDDVNELAHHVIRAGLDAGLRMLILPVAYQRGGFNRPAEAGQRRFIFPTVDAYLNAVDDLRSHYAGHESVTIGLAPHSIRAVDADWLRVISGYAKTHGLPVHIHACEQRREIAESLAEYGKPPVQVLADTEILGDKTTLIHGTHLTAEEFELLAESRPTIAACPTTERNLGDGFLPAKELVSRQIPISLGSDSNATINMFEEMRLVEYNERLRHEERNILATTVARMTGSPRVSTGDVLFPMATLNGARSLCIPAGRLAPGLLPDMFAVNLDHISLCVARPEDLNPADLLNHITLSAEPAALQTLAVPRAIL